MIAMEPQHQVVACCVDDREQGYLEIAELRFALITLIQRGDEILTGNGLESNGQECGYGG